MLWVPKCFKNVGNFPFCLERPGISGIPICLSPSNVDGYMVSEHSLEIDTFDVQATCPLVIFDRDRDLDRFIYPWVNSRYSSYGKPSANWLFSIATCVCWFSRGYIIYVDII